jgi:hypothetical protein
MSRINFLNLVDSYKPFFVPPVMAEDGVKLFFVVEPKGRNERRAQEREIQKLLYPLLEVEETFCGSIFNDDIEMSYEDMYTHCLNEFHNRVQRLKASKNIKHVAINERYFEQLYSKKHFKDLQTEVV